MTMHLLDCAREVERTYMETVASKEEREAYVLTYEARRALNTFEYHEIERQIRELGPDVEATRCTVAISFANGRSRGSVGQDLPVRQAPLQAPSEMMESIIRAVRDIRIFHDRFGATTPEVERAGRLMANFLGFVAEGDMAKFLHLPEKSR